MIQCYDSQQISEIIQIINDIATRETQAPDSYTVANELQESLLEAVLYKQESAQNLTEIFQSKLKWQGQFLEKDNWYEITPKETLEDLITKHARRE